MFKHFLVPPDGTQLPQGAVRTKLGPACRPGAKLVGGVVLRLAELR